jgi:hypothetical protein
VTAEKELKFTSQRKSAQNIYASKTALDYVGYMCLSSDVSFALVRSSNPIFAPPSTKLSSRFYSTSTEAPVTFEWFNDT